MATPGLSIDLRNYRDVEAQLKTLTSLFDNLDETLFKAAYALDRFGGQTKVTQDDLKKFAKEAGDAFGKSLGESVDKGIKDSGLKESAGEQGKAAGKNLTEGVEKTASLVTFKNLMSVAGRGIELGLDTLNLARLGAQKAKELVDAFGNGLKDIGDQIKGIGQNLTTTGLGMVVGGGLAGFLQGQAVNLAGNFEQTLRQVQVFGDLTRDELTSVTDAVLQFSADTIFDPTQSIGTFLEIQKAGVTDLGQSVQLLNDIGNLAAAAGESNFQLAESQKAVLTATQGFNLAITDATEITDEYLQAANNSTASVSELADGMSNVAPLANSFGLTFRETLAVLALFNDAGIRGAEAGTQLKSMLVGMTRPTNEVREEFAKLGVSLTDSAGNFKNMNTIVNELNHAMNDTRTVTVRVNNISAEQRGQLDLASRAYAQASRQVQLYQNGLTTGALGENAARNLERYQQVAVNAQNMIAEIAGSQAEAETITMEINRTQAQNFETIQRLAGSFGGTGLTALMAQGEDAISNFEAEMSKLPGAATVSALMMDTFKGAVESLKGSVDTLLIKSLIPLLDKGFKPLVNVAIAVINGLAALPEEVLAGAAAFVTLSTALVTLTGVGLVLTGLVLMPIGMGLSTLGGLITGLLAILFNPLGLIAGVATLGVGLVALTGILAAMGVGSFIGFALLATLIQDMKRDSEGLTESFNQLKQTTGDFFSTLGGVISGAANVVQTLAQEFMSVKENADGGASAVRNFIDGLEQKLSGVVDFLKEIKSFFDYLNGINPEASDPLVRQNELLAQKAELIKQINDLSSAGLQEYTVQPGDTLTSISRQFGTDVGAIAGQNQIQNTNFIRSGQTLQIPTTIAVDTEDVAARRAELEGQLDGVNARIKIDEGAINEQAPTVRKSLSDLLFNDQLTAETPFASQIQSIRDAKENIDNIVDTVERFGQRIGQLLDRLAPKFLEVKVAAVQMLADIKASFSEEDLQTLRLLLQLSIMLANTAAKVIGFGLYASLALGLDNLAVSLRAIAPMLNIGMGILNLAVGLSTGDSEKASEGLHDIAGGIRELNEVLVFDRLANIAELTGLSRLVEGIGIKLELAFENLKLTIIEGLQSIADAVPQELRNGLGLSGLFDSAGTEQSITELENELEVFKFNVDEKIQEVMSGNTTGEAFRDMFLGASPAIKNALLASLTEIQSDPTLTDEARTKVNNLYGELMRVSPDALSGIVTSEGQKLSDVFYLIGMSGWAGLDTEELATQFQPQLVSAIEAMFANGLSSEEIQAIIDQNTDLPNQVTNALVSTVQSSGTEAANQLDLSAIFGGLFSGEGVTAETPLPGMMSSGDQSGSDLMTGLEQGITNNQQLAIDAATGAATSVQNTLNDIFETHSPSLFTDRLGMYLLQGLANGMTINLILIDPPLTAIKDRFGEIDTKVNELGVSVQLKFNQIASETMRLASIVNPNILSMTQTMQLFSSALLTTSDRVAQLIGFLARLGQMSINIPTIPSVPGGGQVPGRAGGGSVSAGNIYEVVEPQTGGFELLHSDNQTFLLAGRNGYVEPPQNFMGALNNPVANGNMVGGATYNFSPVISIGSNAGVTAAQVESILRNVVGSFMGSSDSEPIEIRLSRAGL